MKVMAVVQARMGSARLPNKVMASIHGRMPMIKAVIDRTKRAKTICRTVLTIPDTVENDALAYVAQKEHVALYRGAEGDLLTRTIGALARYPADAVVRITGDCPLTDPRIIDEVVTVFMEGRFDYVSNVFPRRTYPAGIAVEVYSADTMRFLDETIKKPQYREYYMCWLWQLKGNLRLRNVELEGDLSSKRWTVDVMDDLLFVRAVYNELGRGDWGMEEVLALLQKKPELETINSYILIEPFIGLEE